MTDAELHKIGLAAVCLPLAVAEVLRAWSGAGKAGAVTLHFDAAGRIAQVEERRVQRITSTP